ncbi:unnamed protein product [Clonostachys solani]|uniref:C2H2-type domain-containing protein n=1 Tax=Clonostachys solani TaxID=160281 RepID=A0A9N9YX39_9HYPO|nr:unnamed protein product [Clonostachys solani]
MEEQGRVACLIESNDQFFFGPFIHDFTPFTGGYRQIADVQSHLECPRLYTLFGSLDEYEAREIVARYDDGLEERLLSKRDFTCPDCGQSFVLIGEFTEHRAAHRGDGKNMKNPAAAGKKAAPAKKVPAKKGRK